MGGSVSLYSINVNDENSGYKYLIIKLSNKSEEKVLMFEQTDYIPYSSYEGLSEFEVNYCVQFPYNSLNQCAVLFSKNGVSADNIDNYVLTNEGSPCTSLSFRPGAILYDKSGWLNGLTFEGNRCKLIYRGPSITNDDLFNCCTGKRKSNCHETLINNYKTDHCNVTMQNFCKSNPNENVCYTWLENKTLQNKDIAIKLYSDLCSKNHNEKYCDYMCMFARNQKIYSKYCDISLQKWCSKNNNDSRCWCFNTPSENIPIYEKLLGPKECWLSSCTSNYEGQKWMSADQINIKKKCEIQACIISIDSLKIAGKSIINLINNCVVGGSSYIESVKQYMPSNIEKIQTWGSQFNIHIFLLLISLLSLFIIYLINFEYVKYINKKI
jgi:hypothetical protein